MLKPMKIEAVKALKKSLEDVNSIFITEYTGLNVAQITSLRKNLRENSIQYLVAKNTLMRIAAKDSGHEEIVKYLEGQTALALTSNDPAVSAKILYDSYEDIEKPVIKAFVLDGQVFEGNDIVRLAKLPSREVLFAQVIAAVESPITSIMGSIDGVAQELVATIDALAVAKS